MKSIPLGLKQWTVAFESAAWALLVQGVPGWDPDNCPVTAEPCPQHGPRCVCVTYGTLREHLDWAEQNPGQLAERCVGTMLPRAP